jgi:hypothetical protein
MVFFVGFTARLSGHPRLIGRVGLANKRLANSTEPTETSAPGGYKRAKPTGDGLISPKPRAWGGVPAAVDWQTHVVNLVLGAICRFAESSAPMNTYMPANFEQMATAIGTEIGQVAKHGHLFEAAARWYRLDRRRPKRTAPSKLDEKLGQVAKNARRLLKSLDINEPQDAADGPGDTELLDALVLVGEPDERPVTNATRRIGRLVEIVDAIAAAAELGDRANKAAEELAAVGKLTVREGNPGDEAVNSWIAEMMSLYRVITGKKPATSVWKPNQPNEGIAGGPLIEFLKAAAIPLKIEFSEDAWRSRVRTILKGASEKN